MLVGPLTVGTERKEWFMTYIQRFLGAFAPGTRQSLHRICAGLLAVFVATVALCGAPMPAAATDAARPDGTVVASVVGVEDPEASKVMGKTWVESQEVEFSAGMPAWDVLQPALDDAGCTYDAQDSEYGVFIQSITSSDGLMLEGTNEEPYSFWSFIVNGEPASVGVSAYELQDGDTIELVYYAHGEAPVVEAVPAAEEPAADVTGSEDVAEDISSAEPTSSNTGLVIGIAVAAVVIASVVLFVTKKNKGAAK